MLTLRPVWGIDIGDSALKAVKLKSVGKQIVLQDFQIIRYADIAGDPAAKREDVLPQALAALQAAGLGRDPCWVSIAPQTVFSRFISLPPVDKRRVPEIVLYEARQQIPFNLSEVIWAYQTVRKEFLPGEEIEIGLFAVKRDVVASYLAELNLISKQLHGIQVAPLALYNFIRHDVPLEKPTVVMDIGAQSTDLLIVDGPKFWLRNLPIAGNSFTSVLQKRLNIPRAAAEKLKHVVSESRHRRKLLEVLRPVMRDLVGEVQRSIGYYKSLSQDVKFEEILVTGEAYKLFGLDRFLTEQLQYRVTPVNQLRNIVVEGSPDLAQELSNALPSLGVALGLALQGLGHANVTIDLLPDDFIIRRELHRKRFSGLIAAGLVWAVIGSFYLNENRTLARMVEVEGQGEQTLADVEGKKLQYEREKLPADRARLKAFDQFGQHREYHARVIGAIGAVIPREIEITSGFTFSERLADFGLGDVGRDPTGRFDRRRMEPARGFDRRGMEPSAEEDAVFRSGLTLQFTAACDARLEKEALLDRLPRHLKTAVIFPEKIPLVTGVLVGEITVNMGATAAVSTRPGRPEIGPAPRSEETSRAPVEGTYSAEITMGLLTAEETTEKLSKEPDEETPRPGPEAAEAPETGGIPSVRREPAPIRRSGPTAESR